MKSQIARWVLALIISSGGLSAELLSLTNPEGKTLRAELIDVSPDLKVTLRLQSGKKVTVPHTSLSSESLTLISELWLTRQADKISPLNEAIGHTLFAGIGNLFTEGVSEVATRLGWPEESQTPYTSSYRLYPDPDYRFLGARPFSAVAYGDAEGNTLQLSLVFANKGDSLSVVGSGEDHFKANGSAAVTSLSEAMKHDEKVITKALEELFGSGETQRFGESHSRRTVTRWDWSGHSFLLTALDEEYVGLQIVTPEFANNEGRSERISDADLRKRLESNIVRSDNGDVYIKNIPMVDQGPKGYCAPATFERAMRHVGVPADMYLLATKATTASGTRTDILYDEVKSAVRRKGRRPDDIGERDLQLKQIKKTIDQGVPILWQMCSLPNYNLIANKRTLERRNVTDWKEWAMNIHKEAEQNAEALKQRGEYHICLIIGYNEATQEIAVSDSWGSNYTIRWIHALEAEAVSNNSGFTISL